MEFANVHRFGRFQRGKNRPIVARFIYQTDLDTVMERANWLWRTGYNVHRQFPAAMEEKRRSLIPVMRRYREEGARVKLVRDRLYIDGELYYEDTEPERESEYTSQDSSQEPMESMDYSRAV